MNKKVISSVFENVAERHAQALAILDRASSVTYEELNIRSNHVAHGLLTQSGFKQRITGIFMEESIEYVTAVLGIIKSGNVFMPLDVNQPQERLKYMVETTLPEVIITTTKRFGQLNEFLQSCLLKQVVKTIIICDHYSQTGQISLINTATGTVESRIFGDDNPVTEISGDDSLYLFFTSGSTGKPKAILGCHKSLSHFIHWEKDEFKTDTTTRVSLLAPITFDVSLRDIFLPLFSGGTLCIPAPEIKENISLIPSWIGNAKLTLIHIVPSVFRMLAEELKENQAGKAEVSTLKHILLAGEPLYGRDVLMWRSVAGTSVELTNLYGPTETTLAKVFNRLGNDPVLSNGIVALGRPITNTLVMVIDNGRLCNTGETGELYIKTPFMSKGYFNNAALNEEKFVQNPVHNDFADVVYKTGDMAKLQTDGKIAFVGRTDYQIKVRGNRVELLEVTEWINHHEKVKQVVIIPKEDASKEIILGCFFTADDILSETALRHHAANYLPVYMQPSFYVQLEKLPLTTNGKIDREALKQIDPQAQQGSREPATPTEQKLAMLWRNILDIPHLTADQSFFRLGGSSLKGIKLIARIHKELGVMVRLGELFLHPTLEGMAQFIDLHRLGYDQSIIPLPTSDSYEMSDAQRRLWVLDQISESKAAYNILSNHLLTGSLHKGFLEQSLIHLVERHEILRTVFTDDEGRPKQKVTPVRESNYRMRLVDLSGNKQWPTEAAAILRAEADTPFNLATGPLMRSTLIEIESDKFILLISLHHIVADADSLMILLNEVSVVYNALINRQPIPLSPLSFHYKDYTHHLSKQLVGENSIAHEQYWLQQFSGKLPVLELPTDFLRPEFFTYQGKMLDFHLSPGIQHGLNALVKAVDASLFTGLLSSVTALLFRYTGQHDIILGTPISGRDDSKLKDQLGFYVNTLALRNEVSGNDTFQSLLTKVKARFVEAMEHTSYPFDLLVEKLNLGHDTSRAPLFNVMVVFQNIDNKTEFSGLKDVQIEPYEVARNYSRFDITFNFASYDDGITLNVEFNTDLFTSEHITNLVSGYITFLEALVMNPQEKLLHLHFNSPVPEPETVAHAGDFIQQFEDQVTKTPENVAVRFGKEAITYRILNGLSNQVAHYLLANGYRENDVIGISSERSIELVVGMLGIVKAGAAYLPVDLTNPKERVATVLKQAKACALLSKSRLPQVDDIPVASIAEILTLSQETENPEHVFKPDHLVYVLYTSGSTGIPKGACVTRGSFSNLLSWYLTEVPVGAGDCTLLMGPVSFDLSQKNIFATLNSGGCLLLPAAGILDYFVLLKLIEQHQVRMINCAPAAFYPLLSDSSSETFQNLQMLQYVVLGGESINTHTLSEWYHSKWCHAKIINTYGPTECTDVVSYHWLTEDDFISAKVPIGRPIPNAKLLILDAECKPVGDGQEGELFIGGMCVGKGYINNKELTRKSFVALGDMNKSLHYRTGDLVKKLPDGEILFVGRVDDQVKIRGYRIETGEIVSLLNQMPHVKQAYVCTWEDASGHTQLVAYVASEKEDTVAMRTYLTLRLPTYMIPTYIITLDHFPLTRHGKIDRTLLPAPAFTTTKAQTPKEPQNEIEKIVKNLWVEVLNNINIGATDNFFDVGGNSLKLIVLQRKLSKELQKDIPVTDLFKYNTIEAISKHLSDSHQSVMSIGVEV